MLEVGDTVGVEIRSVEVFGVFCRSDTDDLVVLIPEISWIASFCSCQQFAQTGDRLRVKIKHVNRVAEKITASIKDLYPNPWENDQLSVGKEHVARVVRYVSEADRCDGQPGYLMEMLPGAYVMLPAKGMRLRSGQQCKVIIRKSDPFMQAVEVSISP